VSKGDKQQRLARVAPANPIERRMSKFLREPPSIRMAASVIVTATAVITSTFVARAERERAIAEGVEDAAQEERMDARFDELERRFDRLETMVGEANR